MVSAAQPHSSSADGLVACVKNNDAAGLKKLLEAGADPNIPDSNDMTPLVYCVYRHDAKMAAVLIAGNADVNAKDSLGMTALHHAAFEGSAELVKLLLVKGADARSKDLHSRMPSDFAAAENREDIVSMLVKSEKKQSEKIITNEDLARLRNSDNMVISTFRGSLQPSEDFRSPEVTGKKPESAKIPVQDTQNSPPPPARKLLIGVVGSGDVLNVDCEQGVPTVLVFESIGGGEAEAFVSSQKVVEFMLRNKTAVDALVPGQDGITTERKTVNLVSPGSDYASDYQWHVLLSSIHTERRDEVPCLKSGIAVLGLTGAVAVFTEK
jgi:hypothetical protein